MVSIPRPGYPDWRAAGTFYVVQSGQPPPGEDPFRQPGYGEMPTFPDPFAPAPPTTPSPPPPMTPPGPQPPPPDPYAPYPPAYPPAPGLAGYGAPPSAQSNALGVLALVFGISAIPLGACCGVLGAALGVAGVVLGLLGIRKSDQGQATNRGVALAGAICGGAGILVSILFLIVSIGTGLTPLR